MSVYFKNGNLIKSSKFFWGILLLVQVVLLVFAGQRYNKEQLVQIEISANDLIAVPDNPNVMQTQERIQIVTPGVETLEQHEIVSCGPYIPLAKGRYDITIQYETDTDGNRYVIYCDKSKSLDAIYLKDKDGYFPASETVITCSIRALEDVEAFDIQTLYQGVGHFAIKGITIQQTNADVPMQMIGIALIFLCLDIVFLCRKRIQRLFEKQNYKYTMGILGLIFISGILLYIDGIYTGHDINFHFLRIEGIKEALLSGQFPSKLHPSHIRGYGYATGVLYPEMFLYIPAMLRLLGFSVIHAYKLFVFIVNVLTVCVAFYSFYRMFEDKGIAFAGTVLYTLAPYRILDLYYRAAVGEYCAIIGLPLIAYGIYTFIRQQKQDEKPNWIALAIGYTIVMESHILTMLFVTILTIVIAFVFCRRIVNKQKLVAIGKMVVATLLLNLWFIVPFLDYYRLPMSFFTGTIQEDGVMLAQLFTNQVLGEVPAHSKVLGDGIANEIPFGIGYALLFGVFAFIILLRDNQKKRTLGLCSFIIGFLSVVLSLHVFPWDAIQKIAPLQKIITNIQFPWRFLEIAMIAFVICACVGIEYLSHKTGKTMAIVLICVMSVYGFSSYADPYIEKVEPNDYVVLNTTYLGETNEYLLQDTDKTKLEQRGEQIVTSSPLVSVYQYRKQGTNMNMEIVSESDTEQYIDVPLLMYPGYAACIAETGEKLNVTYGENQVVRVMLPTGVQGTLEISFVGKWYWHVAEWISLLAIVSLLGGRLLRQWRTERL